jgi:hypothetical protein
MYRVHIFIEITDDDQIRQYPYGSDDLKNIKIEILKHFTRDCSEAFFDHQKSNEHDGTHGCSDENSVYKCGIEI